MSLAILLMLTMALVLVGLSAEKVYGGCVTVSVFVHYFALTSVVWMGAEALHAYVPVSYTHLTLPTIYSV